jgi:hypothetical protein
MTPAERADTFERALRPALRVLADPASSPEAVTYARGVLARVTELIDALQTAWQAGVPAVPPERPPPHDARAHARKALDDEDREADGLHPLRQGRDQCTAHRRDGAECQAPAVPGALVCRRHGGAAPQVRIKARHFELQVALNDAGAAHQEAEGTPDEFDALCAWSRAKNALDEYEAKLARLSELRAELRRSKAGAGSEDSRVQDASSTRARGARPSLFASE